MTVRPDSRPGVASGIELACDRRPCRNALRRVGRVGKYGSLLRAAAAIAGWSVRPTGGPGARTAPDLCPRHREPPP